MMEDGDSYDIMCPFGGNKMVLIHGTIADGEEEETAEEWDDAVSLGDNDNTTRPSKSEQFAPDLDDLADAKEVIYADTTSTKHEAWLAVDSSSPQIRQHKSTILRFYSSPLTVAQSKDRLK
jgi:hypothetical protein